MLHSMSIMQESNPSVLAEGRFLRLVDDNSWEFVQRTRGTDVVGIVAITDEEEIVLVEQLRPAVGRNVIELPAGLVGDEGDEAEAPELAAARELEEETGFRAKHIRGLARGASSAGLTDEQVTLYYATGLERVGEGGGVDNESIAVHVVPIQDVRTFITQKIDDGCTVDFKIWSALWLVGKPG
ncbi:MAG: NUDIX hydrolase [Planctomycetota bacterium]